MSATMRRVVILFILFFAAAAQAQQETRLPVKSYAYDAFQRGDPAVSSLLFGGDAGINNGALQVTPDSRNLNDFLSNKSGSVLLPHQFTLWRRTNATTTRVVSFNTTFSINVFYDHESRPGEGLTFVVAPNADGPPPGSHGGFLGLTNATLESDPEKNRFVAVEFDTFRQPEGRFDPDDNHVGLDIGSVKSNVTAPLAAVNVTIATNRTSPANYTVWIEYDGVARRLAVFMGVRGNPKPAKAVLAAALDLSEHVPEKGYLGFTASTGVSFELNCILDWNLTIETFPNSKKKNWVVAVAVAVPVAGIAVAVAAFFVARVVRARRSMERRRRERLEHTLTNLPGMPKEFAYEKLRRATKNFDERLRLGKGGYGMVYKGVLPAVVADDGRPETTTTTMTTEVAVKMFTRDDASCVDDFVKEVDIINRLRHRNIVPLIGYCYKKGQLLLVYEYMPNGSLDQHLFSSPPAPPPPSLGWDLRYSILSGVASALHYLHDEYDQKVIHRDLKASNIMLDAAFSARLGDFGLARAIDTDKTSYMENSSVAGGVHGTVGYIAPECFHTEKATRESDVYAFGAVVLEVVCGRRPRCGGDGDGEVNGFGFLVDWVWRLHRDGRVVDAVDQRLGGEFDAGDAERLLLLGLACSHPTPAERPRTMEITQILLRSAPPPVVPPFKPSFVWPAVVDGDTMTSSSHVSTEVVSSTSTWSGNFVRGADRSRAPLPEQDASGFTV
uniref:non-specific serine/threonine protein kinase n=1 Tax=Leersia perrieri TaxID=77586 RepID=A0A0D9X9Q0_9ORYZ